VIRVANQFRDTTSKSEMRIIVAAFLLAASAFAQPPTFEAATIKPSKEPSGSSHWNSRPGIIVLNGQTLKGLIRLAYGVKRNQIAGGPKWLDEDGFDINAKAEGPANDSELLCCGHCSWSGSSSFFITSSRSPPLTPWSSRKTG
jgi:hypothetical protein